MATPPHTHTHMSDLMFLLHCLILRYLISPHQSTHAYYNEMFTSLSYSLDFKFCDQISMFIYIFPLFPVLNTVRIISFNIWINLLKQFFFKFVFSEVNMWSQIRTVFALKQTRFYESRCLNFSLCVTLSQIQGYMNKTQSLLF